MILALPIANWRLLILGIADCQLPIADLKKNCSVGLVGLQCRFSRSIGPETSIGGKNAANWQSAIGNRQ
jgi:hypothetical protein